MNELFHKFPYLESKRVIIKKLMPEDASALKVFTRNKNIYRYTPTFLPELQHTDTDRLIDIVCEDLFREKIEILMGVYLKGDNNRFCGIAEIYHCENQHVSIGLRLDESVWGQEVAVEATKLLTDYLLEQTDVKTVYASCMTDNLASGKALKKSGFVKIAQNMKHDWGRGKDVFVDKWCIEKP